MSGLCDRCRQLLLESIAKEFEMASRALGDAIARHDEWDGPLDRVKHAHAAYRSIGSIADDRDGWLVEHHEVILDALARTEDMERWYAGKAPSPGNQHDVEFHETNIEHIEKLRTLVFAAEPETAA